MLFGFAPWIVYWVLVGNVPLTTAVLAALVIAVLELSVGRATAKSGSTLEVGAVVTFAVLTVVTFTVREPALAGWVQPLSIAGIFLVALTSVLIGKPFVYEFAAAEQPADVVKTELFGQ